MQQRLVSAGSEQSELQESTSSFQNNFDDGRFKEIVPNTNEEEVLEGPLDMSCKTKQTEENKKSTSVSEIIDIFAQQLKQVASQTAATNPTGNVGTILKHQTYGEVLTTEAVITRLKEAEEKKSE